jgi:mannosyl-3-phosphoglycerate phosphatase
LNLEGPFIFENGGGIVWPEARKDPEYIGMAASELREKRTVLDTFLGESVLFITDMDIEGIMKFTGLTRERAILSRQRLTSLPFLIPSGRKISGEDLEKINNDLIRMGLSITKGGRFYHFLSARSDKGSAIRRVIDYYRDRSAAGIVTIGIGDNENDIPMFRVVDIPVAVRRKDGSIIVTDMDHVRNMNGAGPEGFSEAMHTIIGDD